MRRDAEGAERTAPDWDSLVERLIREAQEDGAFDELPGHGAPLHLDDDRYAGEMAMANHILRNAGAAPPWIEADKEARRRLDAVAVLIVRARRSSAGALPQLALELERLADAYDDAVAQLEGLAPTPRQQRTRLDRAMWRRRLRDALEQDRRAT